MNLSQLEYFRVLAKIEHYTRTAQALCISQPSLTHSIKSLEQELNVALFDRQGRRVKLNRFGKLYLKYVENALEELKLGKEQLDIMVDPTLGKIKLGYITSIGSTVVPSLIRDFKSQEGNHNISFDFTEGATALILERLQLGELDLALTSKIDHPDITCIPLYSEQLFAIIPYGHILGYSNPVTLKELADYPLITYKSSSGIRAVIDEYFHSQGIQPKVVYEFTGEHTICGFVQAGFGVAIVPDVKDIENFQVVKIPFKDHLVVRTMYLSYPTNTYISPPVHKMIQYILSKYGVGY